MAESPEDFPKQSAENIPSSPTPGGTTDLADEYEFSVADVEAPSTVRERARKLLDSRYVDLRIAEDGRSYVISALDVAHSEQGELERALFEVAPITVQSANAARADLESLRDTFSDAAAELIYSSIWINYEAGTVSVTPYKQNGKMLQEVADLIESTKGQGGRGKIVILQDEVSDESEGVATTPYRAGKRVSIVDVGNCTASFLAIKSGNEYGLTAGHCGKNGSTVLFGGWVRGNIQNNTLYASSPAASDASLFRMTQHTSRTLYRTPDKFIKVAGSIPSGDIVVGLNTCAKGASSSTTQRTCGKVDAVGVRTYSTTANRYVNNGVKWGWDNGPGTTAGDSGGPVFRTLPNGHILAVGVHRAGNSVNASYFTGIRRVLSETGSNLATTS